MSLDLSSILYHPKPKIAIFRALFLGDLLMTVPAFRALRRRFPAAEITLIGLPWAAEFVQHIPQSVDRLVPFVGYSGLPEVSVEFERVARFMAEQRAYGYDLAIQMHGDGNVSNGFVAELGAPLSLGFALPGDRRLTHSLPHHLDRNEVLRWLQLVAELGAPTDDPQIDFTIRPADEVAVNALLAELPQTSGPDIVLHAGSKDAARRWPPQRFAALADALVERYAARILLTGSASERDLVAAVQDAMRAPALDLAGCTKLGTLAALLDRADLLVSNDTGAAHLAAATRTRSVVVFGPSEPWQYAPLDRVLHQVVDARALAGPDVDPAEALQQLPVEPVFGACIQQLRLTAQGIELSV